MGSGERILNMSSFAKINNYYINPTMVTHISFTIEDATVHFVGGESRIVSKEEAEKVVHELDEWCASARSLEGRLDDIITTLAQGFAEL